MSLPIEVRKTYAREIEYENKLVLAPMVRTGSCKSATLFFPEIVKIDLFLQCRWYALHVIWSPLPHTDTPRSACCPCTTARDSYGAQKSSIKQSLAPSGSSIVSLNDTLFSCSNADFCLVTPDSRDGSHFIHQKRRRRETNLHLSPGGKAVP